MSNFVVPMSIDAGWHSAGNNAPLAEALIIDVLVPGMQPTQFRLTDRHIDHFRKQVCNYFGRLRGCSFASRQRECRCA